MDIISCNKRICQLIAKQLLERLSKAESCELESWIQSSEENRQIYDKLVEREIGGYSDVKQ